MVNSVWLTISTTKISSVLKYRFSLYRKPFYISSYRVEYSIFHDIQKRLADIRILLVVEVLYREALNIVQESLLFINSEQNNVCILFS